MDLATWQAEGGGSLAFMTYLLKLEVRFLCLGDMNHHITYPPMLSMSSSTLQTIAEALTCPSVRL